MVPAGKVVDAVLDELGPLLSDGDVVVDGGNSFYQDSMRRADALAERGVRYVDCGVSGGVWGLEGGYCLMVGGPDDAAERLRPVFEAWRPRRTGDGPTSGRAAPATSSRWSTTGSSTG
jgi:6-phosphogluconate dehydrogenase